MRNSVAIVDPSTATVDAFVPEVGPGVPIIPVSGARIPLDVASIQVGGRQTPLVPTSILDGAADIPVQHAHDDPYGIGIGSGTHVIRPDTADILPDVPCPARVRTESHQRARATIRAEGGSRRSRSAPVLTIPSTKGWYF